VSRDVQVRLLLSDLDFDSEFSGVWACASLLHVPRLELPNIIKKVSIALKEGGVLYASFKYGLGERNKEERLFSDYTELFYFELFAILIWLVL